MTITKLGLGGNIGFEHIGDIGLDSKTQLTLAPEFSVSVSDNDRIIGFRGALALEISPSSDNGRIGVKAEIGPEFYMGDKFSISPHAVLGGGGFLYDDSMLNKMGFSNFTSYQKFGGGVRVAGDINDDLQISLNLQLSKFSANGLVIDGFGKTSVDTTSFSMLFGALYKF